jgi:hypothetical protein
MIQCICQRELISQAKEKEPGRMVLGKGLKLKMDKVF